MVVQQEIQRLKGLKHSQRKVSLLLGINRETVRSYWHQQSVIDPAKSPAWTAEIDWGYVQEEIKNKVPIKILYLELSETTELPTYSSFCRQCSKFVELRKEAKTNITSHIVRRPGESVETDYSGGSIDIYSVSTGEIISTELFVGTMSNSSKIYAEFSMSQKLEDWIESHNRMYKYYGGVPKYEITDNLKSAVNKTDRYDPEINRTFYDMARHYGLAIDPADARCPKHKPNVEKSVDIIQADFFPRVRNRTFTSLRELNKCLWDYLEIKNAETMKEKGESRNFFFEKEKPLLSALPENPYEICYWKKAKIHPDCCFQFKKNFYSVPYRYASSEVELKYNSRVVYVYCDLELIKCHSISKGQGHFVVDEKDYPEKAMIDTNIHLQYAQKSAAKIGENTLALVEKLIKMPRFPLKNLRKVQAVVGLRKQYSAEAMESAAMSALELNKHSYNFIKSCAKNYRPPVAETTLKAPQRSLELICLQGGKR